MDLILLFQVLEEVFCCSPVLLAGVERMLSYSLHPKLDYSICGTLEVVGYNTDLLGWGVVVVDEAADLGTDLRDPYFENRLPLVSVLLLTSKNRDLRGLGLVSSFHHLLGVFCQEVGKSSSELYDLGLEVVDLMLRGFVLAQQLIVLV